jgi:hypothetical protein
MRQHLSLQAVVMAVRKSLGLLLSMMVVQQFLATQLPHRQAEPHVRLQQMQQDVMFPGFLTVLFIHLP